MARQIEGIELQAVIHLQVGRDELRRRLLARAGREGRGDDNEATIAHRLDVYEAETRAAARLLRRPGPAWSTSTASNRSTGSSPTSSAAIDPLR